MRDEPFEYTVLTLYFMINLFDAFEISCIENIMADRAFALLANTPFSEMFWKVFKT